jgi:hypothetical protein
MMKTPLYLPQCSQGLNYPLKALPPLFWTGHAVATPNGLIPFGLKARKVCGKTGNPLLQQSLAKITHNACLLRFKHGKPPLHLVNFCGCHRYNHDRGCIVIPPNVHFA